MEAKWIGALEELEDCGFVQAASYKREVFTVTREGYDYADSITGTGNSAIAPVRSDIDDFL